MKIVAYMITIAALCLQVFLMVFWKCGYFYFVLVEMVSPFIQCLDFTH